MKVSVIIPVFNVRDYLHHLFEQIGMQKTEDTEYIFIDDGSIDGSGEFLDTMCDGNAFKVIHQNNSGVAAARNCGIDVALGEYIIFIDPDDSFSDNYIENLSKVAIQCCADVVLCDWVKITSDKNIESHFDKFSKDFSVDKEVLFKEMLTCDSVLGSLWGKIFKKSLFTSNSFPLQKTCSDFVPCYKALLNSKKIVFSPDCKYYYLSDRTNSLQNTMRIGDIQDSVEVHREVFDLLYDFQSLREFLKLDLIKAKVQACVHICKSVNISDKAKYFHQYNNGVLSTFFFYLRKKAPLKENVLTLLVGFGYYPTVLALKALRKSR